MYAGELLQKNYSLEYRFKKHLNNDHSNINDDGNLPLTSAISSSLTMSEIDHTTEFTDYGSNDNIQNFPDQVQINPTDQVQDNSSHVPRSLTSTLETLRKDFEDHFLKIILSLHNVDHFNRHDVLLIHNLISEHCLKPMSNYLKQLRLCDKNSSDLHQMTFLLDHIFDGLSSE